VVLEPDELQEWARKYSRQMEGSRAASAIMISAAAMSSPRDGAIIFLLTGRGPYRLLIALAMFRVIIQHGGVSQWAWGSPVTRSRS